MRGGAKSGARTPLLGEAFLISAMMAGVVARRAAAKGRRLVRAAASRSHCSMEWTLVASSSRFLATIRARMSGIVSVNVVSSMVEKSSLRSRGRGGSLCSRGWGLGVGEEARCARRGRGMGIRAQFAGEEGGDGGEGMRRWREGGALVGDLPGNGSRSC